MIAFTGLLFYSILFYPITLEGRWGTTDEFATISFHLDLFSAALVELAKSIPVHCLILSSHLFFCLPLFLFPFTVPCRIVFAKPEDRVATLPEKHTEYDFFLGHGIIWMGREIWKELKSQGIGKLMAKAIFREYITCSQGSRIKFQKILISII